MEKSEKLKKVHSTFEMKKPKHYLKAPWFQMEFQTDIVELLARMAI